MDYNRWVSSSLVSVLMVVAVGYRGLLVWIVRLEAKGEGWKGYDYEGKDIVCLGIPVDMYLFRVECRQAHCII